MKRVLKNIGLSIVETGLYFVLVGCISLSFIGLLHALEIGASEGVMDTGFMDPYSTLVNPYIPLLVSSILAVFIVHKVIFQRDLSFSGFSSHRIFSEFGIGVGWSAVAIGIGFCILLMINMLDIIKIDWNVSLFLGFLVLFIIQSAFEEVVCRSFLLSTVAYRFNVVIGLVVSSIFFGLMHWSNDHMSILGIINLVLAGFFLGIIYLRYRSIWAATGLHAGWNFLQGSFFGFEVSGVDVYSVIDSEEVGPDILTGGAFGFEGSILATFIMIIVMGLIWREAPALFRGDYITSTQEA